MPSDADAEHKCARDNGECAEHLKIHLYKALAALKASATHYYAMDTSAEYNRTPLVQPLDLYEKIDVCFPVDQDLTLRCFYISDQALNLDRGIYKMRLMRERLYKDVCSLDRKYETEDAAATDAPWLKESLCSTISRFKRDLEMLDQEFTVGMCTLWGSFSKYGANTAADVIDESCKRHKHCVTQPFGPPITKARYLKVHSDFTTRTQWSGLSSRATNRS